MLTKSITVSVVVRGVELLVTGSHSPDEPQTRDHPGCGSYFEVETVKVSDPDADITDLLEDVVTKFGQVKKVIEEIETAACEVYEEQAADEWAHQLDRYNSDRLEP